MLNNGTPRMRRLGRRLRQLREEAGLTLDGAAPKLEWSTSKLGRIETGQQGVDVHGVRSMLDLYDIGGPQWDEIIELTREARRKDRWHAHVKGGQGYLRLELDATVVHEYQPTLVPGLLQTEEYMRTLFCNFRPRRTDAEIDRDVQVRLFRQRRLTQEPTLKLVTIIDESALRRPIGGVEVMRSQLRQVVARSALPSVCLQVLPLSLGVHSGMGGSFTVLGYGDPDEPEIAYVEHTVNTLHLHKQGEIDVCKLVFDRLRSEALTPPDSVALVQRLAADL